MYMVVEIKGLANYFYSGEGRFLWNGKVNEMIIDYIKAGFLSNDEILVNINEYLERVQ